MKLCPHIWCRLFNESLYWCLYCGEVRIKELKPDYRKYAGLLLENNEQECKPSTPCAFSEQ